MDVDDGRDETRFAPSLFVAFCWHLGVITLLLGLIFLFTELGACVGVSGDCLSAGAATSAFLDAFAVPVGLGLLIGTPVIIGNLYRYSRSAAEAGRWSALLSQIIAVAMVVVWVALFQ
jgi:hypothetical protein